MVKCLRDCRFLSIIIAIILTLFPETQALCHQTIELKESTKKLLDTNSSKREVHLSQYKDNWPHEKGCGHYEQHIESRPTGYDEKENFDQSDFDKDLYDDYYEYDETIEYRDRTIGKFLLAGSIVLLLLGLCGIIHFVSKKDSTTPSSGPTCYRSHYSNYNTNNARDNKNPCIVNVPRDASSEISENESYFRNIPLPLIYEDRGKICKNAEIFIQRCTNNSLKRTYSAPIETPSTMNYPLPKDVTFIRDGQPANRECSKHGAVRAFFKEIYEMFNCEDDSNNKFKSSKPTKEIIKTYKLDKPKVKEEKRLEDIKNAIRQQIQHPKNEGYPTNKESVSSTTVSIASLLLKPQYQYNIFTYTPENKDRIKVGRKRNKTYGKTKKTDKLAVNKKRHSLPNGDRKKMSSTNPRKKVSLKGSREFNTKRPKRKMVTYDKRLLIAGGDADKNSHSNLVCKRAAGNQDKQFNFQIETNVNKGTYQGTTVLTRNNSTTIRKDTIAGTYDSSKKTMQNLNYLMQKIQVMADSHGKKQTLTPHSSLKRQQILNEKRNKNEEDDNKIPPDPLTLLEQDQTRKNMMIIRYEQLENEVETLRKKLQEFATEFIFNNRETVYPNIGENKIENHKEVQYIEKKKRNLIRQIQRFFETNENKI